MRAVWAWLAETPFGTATLVDWIDIVLLAIVIYRLLVTIRGTRAMQSLVGLALVGALYVAAELLGMSTTHWVLDNLFVLSLIHI